MDTLYVNPLEVLNSAYSSSKCRSLSQFNETTLQAQNSPDPIYLKKFFDSKFKSELNFRSEFLPKIPTYIWPSEEISDDLSPSEVGCPVERRPLPLHVSLVHVDVRVVCQGLCQGSNVVG